jgi:hypothetical protein
MRFYVLNTRYEVRFNVLGCPRRWLILLMRKSANFLKCLIWHKFHIFCVILKCARVRNCDVLAVHSLAKFPRLCPCQVSLSVSMSITVPGCSCSCPYSAWGMDIQHRRGHTAWTMDMDIQHRVDIQHGHGHAAWTWTGSMDINVQHRHGRAASTRMCSMDMDLQRGHQQETWTRTRSLDMDVQRGHGHAA